MSIRQLLYIATHIRSPPYQTIHYKFGYADERSYNDAYPIKITRQITLIRAHD